MTAPATPSNEMLERVRWYASRLAAMSPPEVAHRIGELAKRRISRRQTLASQATDGPMPTLPGLHDGIRHAPPDSLPLAAWERQANDLMQGRYRVLGRSWPPLAQTDPSRWHLDPATGRCWPRDAYCFAIPYRHAHELGDVKYVWELNRLQHLQTIAAHAAAAGDERAAQFCRDEIAGWIGSNPPFLGINWSSGIELALRLVSLLVTISLLGGDRFTADERGRLRACLAAHGYWLRRFPSRFSSANNHLVAEAGALFLLGALAPDLAGAASWKRYGRRVLEREARRQILADGVGAEQSPTYTAFSLEWWMLTAIVAQRLGEPFPAGHVERLGKAGEHLRWLLDENDQHPRIGDDDEGRVLVTPQGNEAYVPAVLEALAGVTGRGALRPNGDYPQFWRALIPSLPPRGPAPQGLRSFRAGGLTVVREPSAAGELLLAFDHGPLGYLSIAAHGHADALAIWLHLAGRPVLVDAGTYLYHAGGTWRSHFRGTVAHNTLAIAGADSSSMSGAFNWSSKARADLLHVSATSSAWHLLAEHDGYVRRFGVRHRRALRRDEAGVLHIEDRLVGSRRPHNVEIGFLVHPALDVEVADSGGAVVRDGGRPVLSILPEAPLTCRIARGENAPRSGWYSAAFGEREAASRVVLYGRLEPGAVASIRLEVWPAPD